MTKQLSEAMDVGKFVAERLIRTETNFYANQGELLAYKESDIERYEFLATLDSRTSELCRDLDGKTFPVEDAEAGVNYPPMHAFCRSTTVARFDGETLEGLERRARDPVTGELYTVPASMNYLEWEREHVIPKILTDGEKYAINQYVSSESYKINEKLRDGLPLTVLDKILIKNLDNALKKMPKYEGLLSRSVDMHGERLERFLAEHSIGSTVPYKAYTSFSLLENEYNPDANIMVYVDSTKGRDISMFNESEKEVLYRRNSRFRIAEVKKIGGQYHIYMEEL